MTLIAHISDLHFGRELSGPMNRMVEMFSELSPDLVAVTGDLTQRATTRQYRSARAFFKSMASPVLAIPGNHDLPIHRLVERFHRPWKRWQRFVHPVMEPEIETDTFIALGLNTVRPSGVYLNWSRGRVKEEQIRTVQSRLKSFPEDRLRIIAAHHPFRLPRTQAHRHRVARADTALTSFEAAGVDLILGGHAHAAFADVQKGMILCLAGTAISNRTTSGYPNSFNLISGDRTHLTLTRMGWAGNDFSPEKIRKFIRNESQWQPA